MDARIKNCNDNRGAAGRDIPALGALDLHVAPLHIPQRIVRNQLRLRDVVRLGELDIAQAFIKRHGVFDGDAGRQLHPLNSDEAPLLHNSGANHGVSDALTVGSAAAELHQDFAGNVIRR
ncbi:MAG: hypothetical protein C4340_08165 [Armatimonadota bacterium]